ncbi:MAG: guanylate kinase [Chloroflexi bacterium]|nr:guanylate kinase [Chloroflexota bacterium]
MEAPVHSNPLLLVLSGPSGVGKDLLLSRLREAGRPYHFTVTVTTRLKRNGEHDGMDYHFISTRQFESMIANEELLEWANVFGNYYGVPKSQVMDAMARGQDVILKIDVQGAATIRSLVPDALFIFLAPPSGEELERRLRGRNTESDDALIARIEQARHELQEAEKFDYTVVHHTDATDEAALEIEDIIRRERHRVPPRKIQL